MDAKGFIPFNVPSFWGDEERNIRDVIARGNISGNGYYTKLAETMLEKMHEESKVLLTTSCTSALEMSARLLNLEPGDEVIVPAYGFVSTASAFAWNGARPVFADVDLDTMNMGLSSAEKLINQRTKAICIIHYAGFGAEPQKFKELCDERNISLIEDNAHGLGGRYRGKTLGTFGSISTLSFHETKNITCGEGGAIVLNSPNLIDRAEVLREKGTDRTLFTKGIVDKYTWRDLGSSWIPSELLAGVLVAQLNEFSEIQKSRSLIWNRYMSELFSWGATNGVSLPLKASPFEHTSHIFFLRFAEELTRDRFITHMRNELIGVVFHYQDLGQSPYARQHYSSNPSTRNSTIASQTLVRLPLYRSLDYDSVSHIINSVLKFEP